MSTSLESLKLGFAQVSTRLAVPRIEVSNALSGRTGNASSTTSVYSQDLINIRKARPPSFHRSGFEIGVDPFASWLLPPMNVSDNTKSQG